MKEMLKNTRIRVAMLLFAGISVLALWSAMTVRQCCNRLLTGTNAVIAAIRAEDNAQTADKIDALIQLWKSDSAAMHLFVPYQPLTDLNETILRLPALNDVQSDELEAELYAVRADLLWIREHELTLF